MTRTPPDRARRMDEARRSLKAAMGQPAHTKGPPMTADVNLGGCEFAPNVIVCRGPRGVHKLITLDCPTCEKPTEMVERWDGAWCGTTLMCRECCDQWQDDFRLPRPLARYWKRDRSERIERLAASALTDDEYKRWTDLDVHRACCNDDTGDCPQCKEADA